MDDCEGAETGLAAGGGYVDGCAKYSIELSQIVYSPFKLKLFAFIVINVRT
jgi:hypothetical protein